MKIFDSEKVAGLLERYNAGEVEVLEDLLVQVNPLVSFMLNMYNSAEQDDMGQEVLIKLVASFKHYKSDVAGIHTYFSTVIRNTCITYFHKHRKHDCEDDLDDETKVHSYEFDCEGDSILSDLLERNRERFPSVQQDVMDSITEFVYASIHEGLNKGRSAIREIASTFHMNREQALAIYSSTVVHLRMKYNDSEKNPLEVNEFSLSPELVQFMGEESFCNMTKIFSGVIIHL